MRELGKNFSLLLRTQVPNDVPIYVTALTVTVSMDSRPAGCRNGGHVVIVN